MTNRTLDALIALADALACDDDSADELMLFGQLPWHIADAALVKYYEQEV